jgi:hypothetical protein
VQVAGGTYPAQTIQPDPAKAGASARVTFVAAPSASLNISGALTVSGSHVEVANMSAQMWRVVSTSTTSTTDVVMRNMTVSYFGIGSSSNVQVLGGSVGPAVDISSNITGNPAPSNILISGVLFHDYVRTRTGVHMECLHVFPAVQLTIVGNRFRNCAVFDALLGNYGGGSDLQNVRIENNVFDAPGSLAGGLSAGPYSIMFGTSGRTVSNVTIDYNSFLGTIVFQPNGTYSNVRIDSNVGPRTQYSCGTPPGISFSYNVWATAACGPTDLMAPSGFTDPANLDLTLTPGAAAIDRGNPSGFPSQDVRGRGRPNGRGPDAGAYEG